jgi:hypothetical protein
MGVMEMIFGKKKTNLWAKEKEAKPKEEKKRADLGVCVPNHAKSAEERKKLRGKREISPFEKLRLQHEKDLGHEVKELMEQETEEPYDFAPELGVQGINEGQKSGIANNEPQAALNEEDELDRASKQMSQGFVPKFSSSARKKLGVEAKPPEREEYETEQPRNTAEFEVTGLYVGIESMISGRVINGKITRRMASQIGKNSVRISDMKRGPLTVDELNAGEHGTIFTRTNAATLKAGDTLEFY